MHLLFRPNHRGNSLDIFCLLLGAGCVDCMFYLLCLAWVGSNPIKNPIAGKMLSCNHSLYRDRIVTQIQSVERIDWVVDIITL